MEHNISTLVQQYYDKREERLAADKVAQALASEEFVLKNQLLQAMRDADLSVAGNTSFQFTRRTKQRILVGDWSLLDEYILQTSSLDFLQRRLSESALFSRMESGILIPGVTVDEYDDLSRPQKVR